MKKIFTIFSLLSFVLVFAQHEVAKKVLELERLGTTFKPFSVLNTIQTSDYTLDKIVEKETIATIKTNEVNTIVTNKFENIELSIPYNGTVIVVDLYKVDLFASGFHVDTDKQKNNNYQKGVYYRGIVKGDYTSIVSFNFFNNELNGIISNGQLANVVVGKLKKTGNTSDYIIYSDANLKVLNDYKCSFKEDDFKSEPSKNLNKSVTSTRCVSLYFEMDYDLFQTNSSDVAATTNWMTSVFNNVQTLYTNEGISVAVKSIFIWTTQDPYEGIGTSSSDYLYKFNEIRPVFDGDIGQLVGIDQGALGGLAVTINGLCNQNNFSYCDVYINYEAVPTYSWTVEVITHEFGHLLGSPHTHACVWNGNNTPIDNCAPYAIGSASEGYSCLNSPATIPTNGGTIMSYCHLVNGVGINFSNGFGIQPANRILAAINDGSCLSTDCVNTCINTISSINIENITPTSATITFVDSGTNVTSWQIAIYPFGGSVSSWTTITSNSYTVNGLDPNTYYSAVVRPDCSGNGLVSGGEKIIFVTAANFCDGITFADSGGTTANYTDMETVVRTIIPNVANNAIVLTFTEFNFELNYDYLYVYDGNSTASTLLNVGGATGTTIPGPFTSSASDGSLTVKYTSDQALNFSGFIANIECSPNLNVSNSNYIDFSYYPNPTNGKITINSKTAINQVSVYNVTGQLLYENEINALNTNVDISSFAIGTYFFKLKFDNDKEANFKVLRK